MEVNLLELNKFQSVLFANIYQAVPKTYIMSKNNSPLQTHGYYCSIKRKTPQLNTKLLEMHFYQSIASISQ